MTDLVKFMDASSDICEHLINFVDVLCLGIRHHSLVI